MYNSSTIETFSQTRYKNFTIKRNFILSLINVCIKIEYYKGFSIDQFTLFLHFFFVGKMRLHVRVLNSSSSVRDESNSI